MQQNGNSYASCIINLLAAAAPATAALFMLEMALLLCLD